MTLQRTVLFTSIGALVAVATGSAFADENDHEHGRATLLVTSTNNAAANNIVVFRLDPRGTASLSDVTALATGGAVT